MCLLFFNLNFILLLIFPLQKDKMEKFISKEQEEMTTRNLINIKISKMWGAWMA